MSGGQGGGGRQEKKRVQMDRLSCNRVLPNESLFNVATQLPFHDPAPTRWMYANAIAKVLSVAELICNGAPLGSGQS